ncbi:MAG: ATP-binding protein [Pyrinomonadaceae bacterium]
MSVSPKVPTPQERRRSRRRRAGLWALGFTVSLLLAIIVSQQLWLWTVIRPDTASDTLVLYALSTLNFVAFVVFSFIFLRNLLKLRRERRERQLGSKIKTRLLIHFISISFLPITAMAVFSYLFLNRSLEKWFYPFPEGLVQEATEVKRQTLLDQNRSLHETANVLVMLLNRQTASDRQAILDEVVSSGQLTGAEIVNQSGVVIYQSRAKLPTDELARLEKLFTTARAQTRQMGDSLADGKDFDVVAVGLNQTETLLVAPQKRTENDLNEMISGSQSEYQELVKKQRRVRLLGLSTLGLMTLMLLFVSSWVAIHLARGIATPIKALAEASNELARGNLSHRVVTVADDELALLAESFNQMTAQLEENRSRIEAGTAELREKNLALQERRNYIETVLQSLSTGVVSVDENDRVTTINQSASRMLKFAGRPDRSMRLGELIGTEDWTIVRRLLQRARRIGHATEQTQLDGTAANGNAPLPVAMTATALQGLAGISVGVVLVIEDLSELLSAQRAAAWSEVARRMAHEIKNPLTPIQLSAERIAKSYHRLLQSNGNGTSSDNTEGIDEDRVGVVISDCTDTISREVASLKAMVDEFSRFARLPAARLEQANLNDVVSQAVGLYEGRLEGVSIDLQLSEGLPAAMLDSEQMRRVFVNLIDNALSSLTDISGDKRILIRTDHDARHTNLQAQVTDTGKGIDPRDFRKLFQPYFSRSNGGTGLGLAIVQQIVLEHRGRIRAEAVQPHGARFIIDLPAVA